MPPLNTSPFVMPYEISMKKERTRKPLCTTIAVELDEKSQALVVAVRNVVIEKRGVGCSRNE